MTSRPQAAGPPDEPLRFLLDFAEAEGALCERGTDASYLLLPSEVRAGLDVDEELTVTADPEVAREDGALLVVHGHPILDRATSAVLDRGDVGCSHLAWPASAPPTAGEIVERARNAFQIDHGRIDPTGAPPVETYLPVLRVGVLVTYAASLEDQFQEREEVWVDALGCRPLDASLRAWLLGRVQEPGRDPTHAHLEPDITGALGAAHAFVETRALTRRAELSRQARGTRETELGRARAYYDAALASIAARAETAPPDRQSILAAQAEVTVAERERRLAEIDERNEARHEIRPFRMHLVGVPALTLAVQVRRGQRAYPLTLLWMLGGGGFAPLLCIHCGQSSDLVAGRERLGCRACLPRRDLEIARSSPSPATTPAEEAPAPAPPEAQAPRKATPVDSTRERLRNARVNGGAASRSRGKGSAARSDRERRAADRERLVRMGNKLAAEFWDCAVLGGRWRGKATLPYSPMAALSRLYGTQGPFWAIGVPPRSRPLDVYVEPSRALNGIHETSGQLETTRGTFPYALRWQVDRGDVVVCELLPYSSPSGALRLPESLSPPIASQLRDPPRPRVALDPVETSIWEATVPGHGLNLGVRCLALWWQVRGAGGLDSVNDDAVVEAVVGLVRERAGLEVSMAGQGSLWGSTDSSTGHATGQLLRLTGDPRDRPW